MEEKKRRKRSFGIFANLSDEDGIDVDGSYTGTAADGGEPVQDADDL